MSAPGIKVLWSISILFIENLWWMWQGIAKAGQHHQISNIITLLRDSGWSHHYSCLWSSEALSESPVQHGWYSHQCLSHFEHNQQMAWHCSGLYSALLFVTFNIVLFISQHEGELLFLHHLHHHLCVICLLFLLPPYLHLLLPFLLYHIFFLQCLFNILLLFLLFHKFLMAVLLFFLFLIILL